MTWGQETGPGSQATPETVSTAPVPTTTAALRDSAEASSCNTCGTSARVCVLQNGAPVGKVHGSTCAYLRRLMNSHCVRRTVQRDHRPCIRQIPPGHRFFVQWAVGAHRSSISLIDCSIRGAVWRWEGENEARPSTDRHRSVLGSCLSSEIGRDRDRRDYKGGRKEARTSRESSLNGQIAPNSRARVGARITCWRPAWPPRWWEPSLYQATTSGERRRLAFS